MVVCVCNAVNCKAIREEIARGATTVGAVYKALGTPPQCGKCGDCIKRMISEQLQGSPVAAMGCGD